MTTSEFTNLFFEEKHNFVFSQGEYITHKLYYNQKRILYRCKNILIEVWYDPYENMITKFVPINIDKALNFYWKEIEIERLI